MPSPLDPTVRSISIHGCLRVLLLGLALASCSGDDPIAPPAARAPLATAQGTALLTDPGFEAGGQGWQKATNGGRSIVTTVVHSGLRAEQTLATSAFARWVYQDMPVSGTGDFDASIWIRTSALAAGASVELVWLTAAGQPDPAPASAVLGKDVLGTATGTSGWTLYSGRFTAPAGAGAVRFTLMVAREPDNGGTAWFDDADFAAAVPPAPDTLAPTVVVTQPVDGSVLWGPAQLQATATDDRGVVGVQFQIDGANVGAEIVASPYDLTVDFATLPNGPHAITATARDAAGNHGSAAPVAVTVQPDVTPPAVSVTHPADGAVVSGAVLLQATASDDHGVAGVRFQVDGLDAGAEITVAPYDLTYDFSSVPNGPHTVIAIARDSTGNVQTSAPVNMDLQNMPELVVDPGFEAGATGWRNVGLAGRTVVSTPVHGGTKSLQVAVNAKYQRMVYQDLPAAAGRTHDLLGWLSTSGLGGAGASVVLTWLTASGLPEIPPAGTAFPDLVVATYNGTRGWASVATTAVAPAGAVVARIQLKTAPEPDGAGSAWFDDLSLRQQPGGTPDLTPPTVVLTAPPAGSTLTGPVTVAASAGDDIGVAGVQFQLDGVNVGLEDLVAPYDLSLDTPAYPDGDHILTAIARDASGNRATAAEVTVRFANAGRPNIVLVLVDDMRYDLMDHLPLTTALLQPEAVKFSRAFVTTPECCPSRASILTGLYSHNTGVLQTYGPYGGAPRFNPSSTIATWLAGAGYRTGLYGKYLNAFHLIPQTVPPGWSEFHAFVGNDDDEYYDYVLNNNGTLKTYGSTPDQYSTTMLTGMATQFILGTPATRPLFLYFNPFGPHAPAIPEPSDVGSAASLPAWRPPAYNEADVSDKPAWVQALPLFSPTVMASEDLFHQHQVETLQSVDRAVASLIAALQQSDRWATTLLIFLSDNGLAWGEHRLRGKTCLYEECVRVPLWIRAPGVTPAIDTNLVAGIDLAPTIAAWAGVTPSTRVNGASLLPLLSSPNGPWRSELLLEFLASSSPTTTWDAVRTTQYVYGEYLNGDRELYDLVADPDQLQNLAGDPAQAATVASLQASLILLRSQ